MGTAELPCVHRSRQLSSIAVIVPMIEILPNIIRMFIIVLQ